MRILNYLLSALALAGTSAKLVPCHRAGRFHKSPALCPQQKRKIYLHVDHAALNFTSTQYTQHLADLAEAGATHLLLGRVLPADDDVTSSAARWDALSIKERADIMSILDKRNTTLLMTIGSGYRDCAMYETPPLGLAHKWCGYARDKGYKGINWNLNGLTATSEDDQQVAWITRASAVCRTYVDLVTYSISEESLVGPKRPAIEAIIDMSTEESDRFLIYFPDAKEVPTSDYTMKFGAQNANRALARLRQRHRSAHAKLVMGKYMGGYGCTSELPIQKFVQLLEEAEDAKNSGDVAIFKAPAQGSVASSYLLEGLLPQISMQRNLTATPTTPAPTSEPVEKVTSETRSASTTAASRAVVTTVTPKIVKAIHRPSETTPADEPDYTAWPTACPAGSRGKGSATEASSPTDKASPKLTTVSVKSVEGKSRTPPRKVDVTSGTVRHDRTIPISVTTAGATMLDHTDSPTSKRQFSAAAAPSSPAAPTPISIKKVSSEDSNIPKSVGGRSTTTSRKDDVTTGTLRPGRAVRSIVDSAAAAKMNCTGLPTFDGQSYGAGEKVVFKDALWRPNFRTATSPSESDPRWTKIADCSAPVPLSPCVGSAWTPEREFEAETVVHHMGALYKNQAYAVATDVPNRNRVDNWIFLTNCLV